MPGRSESEMYPFSILRIVGEAREHAEHAGIAFRAAEAEAGRDRERHLVAAVREVTGARPLVFFQRGERARILRDAVGLRRIDLDDIAAARLSGCRSARGFRRPASRTGSRRSRARADRRRRFRRASRSRADRTAPRTSAACRAPSPWRSGAPRRGRTSNWHRPQARRGTAGCSSPPRCGACPRRAARRRLSSSPWCSRHRDGASSRRTIPRCPCRARTSRRRHRRSTCRDCRRGVRRAAHAAALSSILATASQIATSIVPMPTERSECPPDFSLRIITAKAFRRIEIVARLVQQRFRLGLQDARNEARAHLRAAGVAAGGIEREAGNRLSVAHHVGDHRDDRGGHLGEIDRGVLQRGIQRDGGFADVGDAHLVIPGPSVARSPESITPERTEVAPAEFSLKGSWLWIPGPALRAVPG